MSGVFILLGAAVVVAVVCRPVFAVLDPGTPMSAWSTVFIAVVVQALPFLALGVVVSGLIDAFVPDSLVQRLVPRRTAVAVPVAAAAGVLLPGCECASVPVAARLMRRGVAPATAIAFLLSAPAINPVVLVATAVAFPHRPSMVLARFGASLATAAIVGWLWPRLGRPLPARVARMTSSARGWQGFQAAVRHDLFQSGGFLVIGSAAAATINIAAPASWLHLAASTPVLSVLVLAVLAVLLCVCSEADAFVASSLIGFPAAAQLAFMVVGPAVDLKLIAMQVGAFGRPFAARLAPLSFAAALTTSVLASLLLT
jgi:uncharacterized membrane protein YraQ (UPF0718 family)